MLVHGDPALIPFGATFAAAAQIADLIRYTGYVAAPAHDAASADGHGEVLVSAGGGAVGAPLLFAALAARPLTPLAGTRLALPRRPEPSRATTFDRLAAQADGRTIVERFRAGFSGAPRSVPRCRSRRPATTRRWTSCAPACRAVVVPYETTGETEQRLRAEILAAEGPADASCRPPSFRPRVLPQAMAEALARPRPHADHVDLSGARHDGAHWSQTSPRGGRR